MKLAIPKLNQNKIQTLVKYKSFYIHTLIAYILYVGYVIAHTLYQKQQHTISNQPKKHNIITSTHVVLKIYAHL